MQNYSILLISLIKKYTVKHSVHFIFATLIILNACSQLTVKSLGTTAALCCLPKKGHESSYLSTSVRKIADQLSVVCSITQCQGGKKHPTYKK
jgi:hypothetical protein